ncbi:MAG: hypothetical protein ACUVR8_07795 [Acidobacteriota bacterium]
MLKILISSALFTPAAQWWFVVGVTLVVFFVLLAAVLLWVAWRSLRVIPDQRDVGDDGLLGLVSQETPSASAPDAEGCASPPLPVPSALEEPPPVPSPAPALASSGPVAKEVTAYRTEPQPSASALSSLERHTSPALPVEIRPKVTTDQVVDPTKPPPKAGVLFEAFPSASEDLVTKPLTPAPTSEVAPPVRSSLPPGLLAEEIRMQLAPSPASPKPDAALPAQSATEPLSSSPPSTPKPEATPNPLRAGLTEQLPVQRKSLHPPALVPKATPSGGAAPREIETVTPSATATAIIAASETTILGREVTASAQASLDVSGRAAEMSSPPLLPVQQMPAVSLPSAPPQAESPAPVAPPRFLADDRPTGIRREMRWLGAGLVVYAFLLIGLAVIFFPTLRNQLLPPAWAERVAVIPRSLGLESLPVPPPPVKQVEVWQYANAYSSAPKGSGKKVVRMVTIAGLVKNITNETLYDLRVEIELYPREPEGSPPERRTIYLVPNLLGPQQEGRYTLTVADAEYRQSSLKRIVTGDGKDLKEVPAMFIQELLDSPEEAEIKSAAKPAAAKSARMNR